ncbi:hypothetical protein AB4851_12670 [Burkholderia sp. 22PA0099]|uniref:hypothetical protein n=1 Tax=Burkholderia sp. 22PA0099 TaxID=3237372 RepID=UPI0039C1B3F2
MMRGETGPIVRTPFAARALRFAVLNGVVALVLAALAGGLAASVPAAAAALCPSCFGFVETAPALYLERSATAADAARARAVVEAGRQRVRAFWGDTTAAPRVLVCVNDACFQRMGGGAHRALSLYDRVVVLSPRATDPQSVAHPFAAAEFEHRLGPFALADGRAPAWLGNSLASISAGKPDDAARCARDTAAALPGGLLEWGRRMLTGRGLPATPACGTPPARLDANHMNSGQAGMAWLDEAAGSRTHAMPGWGLGRRNG